MLARLRAHLHRPYLRAAVASLALTSAAAGIATAALELRFAVPARAVVRFFARLHSGADDLMPALRAPGTLAELSDLDHAVHGMNRGGLVYLDDGMLRFHPWMPAEGSAAAERRSREQLELYLLLCRKYFAAELDELLGVLAQPEVRRHLGRRGIAPSAVSELQQRAAGELAPRQRIALIRKAGGLIRPLMPAGAGRYRLELADKLRFYAERDPGGRYLGLYEVRGPRLWGAQSDSASPGAGRRLVITRELDGSMTIEDLRPSRRRIYRLIPVRHPAGLPLYRVAVRA